MKTQELNEYIKHYLEKDKTHSAIMLKGAWGTGKSHYIRTELVDYLKEEDKTRTVIVSLYGLKEVSEISRSIYLEMKLSKYKFNCSEKIRAGILAGKTLIKGAASFFNIDLDADENALQKLYESIDLSGKLIILEDIERSEIDLLQLLGYVNSLVEQDNVKVLLVANEDEFLKFTREETQSTNIPQPQNSNANVVEVRRIPTETTLQYLRTKEKTVSDTINFENDYRVAIKNIIESFENDTLNRFLCEENLNELEETMIGANLRSFIFACQKTVDLYEKLPKDAVFDDSFIKAMFFGIIQFSLSIKTGEKCSWEGNSDLSTALGGSKYPLFRFCYDYINKQKFNISDITKNANAFKELQLYDRQFSSAVDDDVVIINYYYTYYEKEVIEALKRIEDRLVNAEDISFYAYRGLAKGLVQISRILEIDISLCKTRMIENLKGRGNKLNGYFMFGSIPTDDNMEDREKYEEFKNQMLASLDESDKPFLGFDYTPENLEMFYLESARTDKVFNADNPYAKRLDMDKLIAMLLKCSPEQIETVRISFHAVYDFSNVRDYLSCDKDSIKELMIKVKAIKDDKCFDKIQKIQIGWLIHKLEEIYAKL